MGGIISYHIDGLEEKLNKNFGSNNHKRFRPEIRTQRHQSGTECGKNTPLFKVINNYDWYIVGSLSKELAEDWEVNNEVLLNSMKLSQLQLKQKFIK